MGYGPPDENRFGWCYRNEHGSGKRLTPYFETEEMVEKFHSYLEEHKSELKSSLPPDVAARMNLLMGSTGFGGRMDLRIKTLSSVNNLARQYVEGNKDIKVVIEPVGETMREFYGVDQENDVGYIDPTPFPWEEDNNDEEEE